LVAGSVSSRPPSRSNSFHFIKTKGSTTKPRIIMTHEEDMDSALTLVRKLRRTKRRLLLELAKEGGAEKHHPQPEEMQPYHRCSSISSSGSDRSLQSSGSSFRVHNSPYEEVSVARKLQRMKRKLLLEQASQRQLVSLDN
jgi:hypothetical protein